MYPTLFTTPGVKAFAEKIDRERQAQLAKFGDQHHPDGTGSVHQQNAAGLARMECDDAFASGYGTWCHVLFEEVREALAESDPAKLRAELVQVAAVCAAWIHDIDSRPAVARQIRGTETAPAVTEEPETAGNRQCGHDDYHDAHEWADRPHIWCPGHSLTEEPTR
ncbi:hypothetical protein ABT115_15055 [Streptomyces sp. NPDC001832]|uniref:hypothetical protein n=1 Tax=Streptomyces sp. NPDC001832 TaxID=3154527 RepID=UPI00331D4211